MADTQTLDKAFHVIMSRLLDTGQAPHYSELATALGCPIEEGRQIVHDLAGAARAGIRLNPRYRLDRHRSSLFGDTHPIPDHRGRPAEMVRPMRA